MLEDCSNQADPPAMSPAGDHEVAASLLSLPAELLNIIYAMVIAETPSIPFPNLGHPAGQFTLRQPALARVNRQLRSEILPMWYSGRVFGICIYPKRHSEADQVWQDFLDRFRAHTTRDDGIHHLSGIQYLQVELWHPAFGPDFELHRRPEEISAETYHLYRKTREFPLGMCNGVYLHFGCARRSESYRVGDDDIDWADRGAVQARLKASIVKERHNNGGDVRTLARFWKTFPFDRLVDAVMMVAAECKEAARSCCYITTSFAP